MDTQDQTFEELLPKISNVLSNNGTFWGKFTCKSCGSRQTFEEPNKLFKQGKCEECQKITDLDHWGLLVLLPLR